MRSIDPSAMAPSARIPLSLMMEAIRGDQRQSAMYKHACEINAEWYRSTQLGEESFC
jgi:hypothetical protein